MDDVIRDLLRKLEASPTDLKKLVWTVLVRDHPAIAISSATVERWRRDDPQNWAAVHKWLLSRGIEIIVEPRDVSVSAFDLHLRRGPSRTGGS